jgi:hypothetical protein
MAKLKINSYTGPSDGADLEGFYFEPSGDGYNLYAPPVKVNTQLITPQNPTFTVQIPAGHAGAGLQFTCTVTSFPNLTLIGSWSDPQSDSIRDLPGSGTFQAQAGGTSPMEEEAAAAASAK